MKKVLDEVDKEKPRMLPIHNFQEWLDKQVAEDKYRSIYNLSKIIGVSNKSLETYKSGRTYGENSKPITKISIDIVDKCAVRCGYHISEIYPDYYEWPTQD